MPLILTLLGLLCALLVGPSARAAERAIDKEAVINAPLAQVWAAWTTREGIVSFFAPDAKIEPQVGGAFQIYMDPGAAPGRKGADDMRFMAVQPMKMISFDWNAPPHLAQARAQRTFVVVRFFPVDAQRTRVTLHHTGWGEGGEWEQAHTYFERAWGGVLVNLQKRFETGPRDWREWLQQLDQWRADEAKRGAAAGAKP